MAFCLTLSRRLVSVSLVIPIIAVILYLTSTSFAQQNDPASSDQVTAKSVTSDNHTAGSCNSTQICKDGIILRIWHPADASELPTWERAGRATLYFLCLIYLFLGVSIIADRFMAAIEVITSQERTVTIQRPNGETVTVNIRTWNETVSNLTLMALGSSAPEILLSIIEVIGNGFDAGDLGPGTIVGSAAFNLFVIIGLCVLVIPNGEVRRIKHLRVFIITASWSIFAYLWLYIIIAHSSPNVVEVWEGVITFLFFPLTVITAYIADKKIFFNKFLSSRYRATLGSNSAIHVSGRENLELDDKQLVLNEEAELKEFEKTRQEYIGILREMRKRHPDVDMKTLEEMSAAEVLNRGPKSRAFYRIQATRKLTGGGNIIKKKVDRHDSLSDIKIASPEEDVTRIFFDPGHYTVMENVGAVKLTVARQGGDMNNTVYVDYRSEDGTANAGTDYDYAEGTVVFFPGESQKQFSINIIDDEVFEEDEHFFVGLSNVRVDSLKGDITATKVQLVNPSTATVMILDDDHAGIFHFDSPEMTLPESIGETSIRVIRSSGARGSVRLPFRTIDESAKAGNDYVGDEGELQFDNDETEAVIRISIVNHQEYERNQTFRVELSEPYSVDSVTGLKIDLPLDKEEETLTEEERIAIQGQPRLGEQSKLICHIRESIEFRGTVDKLLTKANTGLVVGTSSWREQFIEAVTVSSGDDDDNGDDDGEKKEKKPSCGDYVMHSISIFWKILFAFVPPTDYLGGWASFTVSIIIIGFLTAIIGDVASQFGCTVGLADAVTALSFVALGTSIPDTFASKVAALHDEYADSSVGNVTGSNAVNVFLGIGIAWSIAAIHHAIKGTEFRVPAGSLGFSVTMFCCCSLVCIGILLLRRLKPISGELGGPTLPKYLTAFLLFGLWIFYVLMSSLETYCHIKGF